MSLGRRDFIKTAAAFGAAGPALAQGASAPNLRVGILSDIHVTALSNADWFEKALRYFDGRKVDAVLITGPSRPPGSRFSPATGAATAAR